MNQPKSFSSSSWGRFCRALALASGALLSIPGANAQASRVELPLRFTPTPSAVAAVPPLPTPVQFPVQLVVDDDASEGTVGVAGNTARQFLWFNRFTPGGAFELEETWVLFPAGDNMAVGAAVQIAVYQDLDANPANGATLLGTFDETIQAVDGNTFSIYSTPVSFDGAGDLLIGVVPRFIVSGVTSPTGPAALDTTASQSRSWLGIWSTDPPNPPSLTPPPDVSIALVDTTLPGNWMIRGFGTPPPVVAVPTMGEYGMVVLALALALAAAFVLRRRGRMVAGVLLALASAGAAEAQITIDTFTTNQTTLSAPPNASSSVTGGADIVGTRRGIAVQNLQGAGPTTAGVAGGNLTVLVTATTPDSRGEARLSWDGDTNPNVLTPTGLGGVNLTAGNASGFRFQIVSTSAANVELILTVHTNGSNSSRASRLLTTVIGAPGSLFLPYSEFRTHAGTGANFGSVGAIELTVRATEATVVINEIHATAPTVAATKVDTQIIDADGDTRADPGDRLRYTITVTNTGNEGLNVALSDTIDANTMLVAGSVSSTPIARNDQYVTVGNVVLNANGNPGKPALLANDSDPDGDTVSVQAGTFPATSARGGALTLVDAATGTFTYSPPAGLKGVDSFSYTIVDDNSNTSTATATITMDQVVWFIDDTNTTAPHLGTLVDPFPALVAVNGAGGAGDPDGPGDFLFVFDDDGTAYAGGIQLEADQHLIGEADGLILNGETIVAVGNRPQITNDAGVGVLLSTNNNLRGFDVQASAGVGIAGTSFGTLTTTNLNVLSSAGATLDLNTGNLFAAFGTLSSSGGTQRGLLLDTVTGSLNVTTTTLTNPLTHGIRVVNSPGLNADFGNTTVTDNALGVAPSATGIDIASSAGATLTFDSLALTTDGAGLVSSTSATLNIAGTSNTIAATGGAAVDLSGATSLGGGATFASLSSTNSTGKGVNLDTVAGSFVANGGSISNPAGTAFDLNAGSATVTYAGSISNTANAFLIEVTGRTGGTTTFSGNLSSTSNGNGINVASNTGGTVAFSGTTKTLNTGADAAVTLATNNGATVNFTGGGLDIDTTSGAGFNATGGAAAITVQGGGNTITTGTGTALNVANTTIGASGLTFQAIASNGGTNGIVLNNTGATAGLTVTGTGSPGTGGTIQNKSSDGVSLTLTRNANLSWMELSSNADAGLYANQVTDLTLTSLRILNNTNALVEAGLELDNLWGTNTFTSLEVSGSTEDNINLRNDLPTGSGTLSALAIQGPNCFVRNNSAASGNVGINIQAAGTADLNGVVIDGCSFQGNRTVAIRGDAADSGQLEITIRNNVIVAGAPNQGNQGIEVGAATTAQVTFFDIDNNRVGTDGVTNSPLLNTGINVSVGGSAGSSARGRIRNNTVVNAGAGMSGFGIRVFQSSASVIEAQVANNTVSNVGLDYGLLVESGGSAGATGRVDAAVTGNTVSVLAGALDAIRAQARNGSTMCARINSNTASHPNDAGCAAGATFCGMVVRQANTAVFNLEGSGGSCPAGAQTPAQAAACIASLNVEDTATAFAATSFTGVATNFCTNIP